MERIITVFDFFEAMLSDGLTVLLQK
jgi:hypothetical protein